jgi:hypothetical protein
MYKHDYNKIYGEEAKQKSGLNQLTRADLIIIITTGGIHIIIVVICTVCNQLQKRSHQLLLVLQLPERIS